MKIKNFIIRVISILFIFLFTLTSFITLPYSTVKAEETNVQYTDVMEDLKKDKNFDASLFIDDDFSYILTFITLAEGANSELFVYLSNSSANNKPLIATEIRFSTALDGSIEPRDYSLSLVSESGIFFKYVVDDFTVSKEKFRVYDVVSVYRRFDSSIDVAPTEGSFDSVVYSVGKQIAFDDTSTETKSFCRDLDVVIIRPEQKYVGRVRYQDGAGGLYAAYTDSHFIAFSCDRRIDDLLKAEVSYYSQEHLTYYNWSKEPTSTEDYDKIGPLNVSLDATVEDSNNPTGFFQHKYTWPQIQTVSEFLKETEIIDVERVDIKDKQWVLRFATTPYTLNNYQYNYSIRSTSVYEVSILSLTFVYDGDMFNLGVVDNKQTPDQKPDAVIKPDADDFLDWVKKILAMIAGLAVLGLIAFLISLGWPVILIVFKALWTGIKFLFKIILWLILFPFNLISVLVKKIKEKRQTRQNTLKPKK